MEGQTAQYAEIRVGDCLRLRNEASGIIGLVVMGERDELGRQHECDRNCSYDLASTAPHRRLTAFSPQSHLHTNKEIER